MNHPVVTLVTTKADLEHIKAGLKLRRAEIAYHNPNMEVPALAEIDTLAKQVESGLARIAG